jgi:mRNA-degrading endonuclease RelE of RelBE toxin-antitoxin system
MILRYHPAAIQEAQNSTEWYNRQEEGLGMEFSAEIGKAVGLLKCDPARLPKTAGNLQVARVKRFPYSIYFHFQPETSRIFIVSIFHHRRRPGSWLNRIRDFRESPE